MLLVIYTYISIQLNYTVKGSHTGGGSVIIMLTLTTH